MYLLKRQELETLDILRGATSLAAELFGLHDCGAIQLGLRADLVLIRDDPFGIINATRSIQRV